MGYAEVKKIYNANRLDVFVMAISYLMDIGFRNAKEITDEDIDECEGNGLMTKSFCQELMKIARDIANVCEPSELIQLCQAEDVFDIPDKMSRTRMEKIICGFIGSDPRSFELMVADGTFEPEDLLELGYWTEEEVDEYYEKQED